MDQEVLDLAVKLATRLAVIGLPVERIVWHAPEIATTDAKGTFIVYPCPPLSPGETPPWEK